MTAFEIEQAKIGFVQAHVMMYELVFCVNDEKRYNSTADKLFDLVPKLCDFVAKVLCVPNEECADITTDMIQDSQKAQRFFNEHFERYAS